MDQTIFESIPPDAMFLHFWASVATDMVIGGVSLAVFFFSLRYAAGVVRRKLALAKKKK